MPPLETPHVEIPDELLVLARRLHTQDNLCTGDPLFCVQQRVRDYGFDPAYASEDSLCVWHNEDWEWILDTADQIVAEELRDWKEQLEREPTEEETEAFMEKMDAIRDQCEAREDVELPGGSKLEICFYKERWEFVTAHFTQAAAEDYLVSNSHHFRHGARIYVTSQYRCYEWNAVRRFLLGLVGEEAAT